MCSLTDNIQDAFTPRIDQLQKLIGSTDQDLAKLYDLRDKVAAAERAGDWYCSPKSKEFLESVIAIEETANACAIELANDLRLRGDTLH